MEGLSVEGMMSRSFRENDHQKKLTDIQRELAEVDKKLAEEHVGEFGEYMKPLIKFYDAANDYLLFRQEILVRLYFDIITNFSREGRKLLPIKEKLYIAGSKLVVVGCVTSVKH